MNIPHNGSATVFHFSDCSPEDLFDSYLRLGGYQALRGALRGEPEAVIAEIQASGLRGRGGAAFPSGQKMRAVRSNPPGQRYVICNADEGEPGTFKDRFILTHSPFQLLEGMTLAAYAVGATQGIIYIRHEYPEAQAIMRHAISEASGRGLLGKNILGSGIDFEVRIFSGAGSYLCGEETALLSSVEGKKGRPRVKPPYPTQSGLWGCPTLIHNVETLANMPPIFKQGAAWYRSIGTVDSPGTKLISLSGDVKRRGIYEVPFGASFMDIIVRYGGGVRDGHSLKAVNIGGASGVLVPAAELDCPLEYAACAKRGITIGSGAVFVLDDSRSIVDNVRNRIDFFLHESCGQCTPCREGLRQAHRLIHRLANDEGRLSDVENLERYTRAMQEASFCGLGLAAGNSIVSALRYFRAEFEQACMFFGGGQEPPKEESAS